MVAGSGIVGVQLQKVRTRVNGVRELRITPKERLTARRRVGIDHSHAEFLLVGVVRHHGRAHQDRFRHGAEPNQDQLDVLIAVGVDRFPVERMVEQQQPGTVFEEVEDAGAGSARCGPENAMMPKKSAQMRVGDVYVALQTRGVFATAPIFHGVQRDGDVHGVLPGRSDKMAGALAARTPEPSASRKPCFHNDRAAGFRATSFFGIRPFVDRDHVLLAAPRHEYQLQTGSLQAADDGVPATQDGPPPPEVFPEKIGAYRDGRERPDEDREHSGGKQKPGSRLLHLRERHVKAEDLGTQIQGVRPIVDFCGRRNKKCRGGEHKGENGGHHRNRPPQSGQLLRLVRTTFTHWYRLTPESRKSKCIFAEGLSRNEWNILKRRGSKGGDHNGATKILGMHPNSLGRAIRQTGLREGLAGAATSGLPGASFGRGTPAPDGAGGLEFLPA